MISCHCCSAGDATKLCGGCHLAAYCGKECQLAHEDEHLRACADVWAPDNVKQVIYPELRSASLRRQLDACGMRDVPLRLRAEIGHDLLIGGKIFQTYMKTVLRTAIGRKRVADKLRGRGDRFRYLTRYTNEQVDEIREIVEKDPRKYDPDGNIKDALKSV